MHASKMSRSHQPIKNFTIDEILQKVSEAGSSENNLTEGELVRSNNLSETNSINSNNANIYVENSCESKEGPCNISYKQTAGSGVYTKPYDYKNNGDEKVLTGAFQSESDALVSFQRNPDDGNLFQPDVQPCTSTDTGKVRCSNVQPCIHVVTYI